MEPAEGRRRPGTVIRLASLLLVVSLLACQSPSAGPTYAVAGHVVAGPTCPVEPASPLPGQCAPRPVAGAALVITDAAGNVVARLTAAAYGAFSVQLAGGTYTLTPQPVPGLMGTAPAVSFTVSASDRPTDLRVEYDTGIR